MLVYSDLAAGHGIAVWKLPPQLRIALSQGKMVGGQEDMIVDIALDLAKSD